jgi:hypothetical protein
MSLNIEDEQQSTGRRHMTTQDNVTCYAKISTIERQIRRIRSAHART